MIYFDKKSKNMGYFDNETEAALAYNECISEIFGPKAILNEIPKEEIISFWGFDIFKED
jgi:hypothetical protein